MQTIKYKDKLLYLMDDYNSTINIKNNLEEFMKLKKISSSDLAKITGLSKHRISEILNQNVIPKIDAVLIISYALNVPIEKLYSINNPESFSIYQDSKGDTLYFDNINKKVLSHKEVRYNINQSSKEYYDAETKELLSKKEYLDKTNIYKKSKFEEIYNRYVIDEVDKRTARKETFKYLDDILSQKYKKIYTKLYEKNNIYKID